MAMKEGKDADAEQVKREKALGKRKRKEPSLPSSAEQELGEVAKRMIQSKAWSLCIGMTRDLRISVMTELGLVLPPSDVFSAGPRRQRQFAEAHAVGAGPRRGIKSHCRVLLLHAVCTGSRLRRRPCRFLSFCTLVPELL
ncbi:hypothetical protein ACFE04_004570 [Oxalis oulophora]